MDQKGEYEPREPTIVLEVKPNIPFQPFESLKDWYSPKGELYDPRIPDEYSVLLRRKIKYAGIEGFIDLMSESLFYNDYPFITAIDGAEFELEETDEEGGIKAIEELKTPVVVRLSFILKNPRDYLALLSVQVELITSQGNFLLLYPEEMGERKYLEEIELSGEKMLVRDGYLKVENVSAGDNLSHKVLSERVWFPNDNDSIDAISLIFRIDGDSDNSENATDPVQPLREKEHALV